MTASFEIKSAHLPVMTLLAKTADLQQVAVELLKRYGPASDNAEFFEHDAVVIDSSKTKTAVVAKDLSDLMQALLTCRLKPVAFRGSLIGDASAALALGLVMAPLELVRNQTSAAEAKKAPPVQVEVIREVVRDVVREVVREVPAPAVPTLIIDKPIRSGQKVYARGADLVLLAMVNQGGEVVADGNIHVYAPLRGKAMAGASGNASARIFSICLEPELISIAGVYRTSENPLAPEIQGKAAQVRLSDDGQEKLLFEALTS
ncbi:septum site-determining protein MinC [Rhodoferax antarcticus]|uniref:septum site-determining protein MinC n=1 Tax=Rhodoferax antarcticus TaxID=81479 RepID=UPI00222590BF|nr:septum site-determining protein MinC [Rhodoferax antarcticus]MCW2310970.1 septum site-determining protein MinC [Rhodoferax antarcticus]